LKYYKKTEYAKKAQTYTSGLLFARYDLVTKLKGACINYIM